LSERTEPAVTPRFRCTSRLERMARKIGFRLIAGLDEAGRGSLFGPVFAAAVVLDPAHPVRGLNDSKQLDPDTRESLAVLIRRRACCWAVARAEAAEIDRINIYQASRLAMRRALEQLTPQPDFLLVDALRLDTLIPQRGVIHGDARSHSIAAASILAKVDRDACLREMDPLFPNYGLARNKGYSTPEHLRALDLHGPTSQHRFSYQPVRLAAGLDSQLSLFAEAGHE
jgi:ribonuclease HII